MPQLKMEDVNASFMLFAGGGQRKKDLSKYLA